jgi:translation initiation factor IF-3
MRIKWRKAQPIKPTIIFRSNAQIRVPEVSVINEDGEQIGTIDTAVALQMAVDAGMDLVEVNPKTNPPVVKIMDFGQFRYEREKKAHKQKLQMKKVETKNIRLSVRISEHDFDFRLNQAEKFLAKDNKLKVEIMMRGREKQYPQKAMESVTRFINALKEKEGLNIEIEQPLTRQEGRFNIILFNKK